MMKQMGWGLPMLAVVAAAAGAWLLGAATATPRIGIVDIERVRGESVRLRAELARLSAPTVSIQEELKARRAELARASEQYQAQQAAASADANAARRRGLESLAEQVRQLERRMNQSLGEAEAGGLGPLRDAVFAAIGEVARQRGVELMLSSDKALYHAPALDLTGAVIARLDAGTTTTATATVTTTTTTR